MRLTISDSVNLCKDYANIGGHRCKGCQLAVELDKPAKERNKAFLKRIEPAVLRLRKMNRNKD